MFDFQRIYHTGISVPDVRAAKQKFSRDFNLKWCEVRTFDPLPVWTPKDGMRDYRVVATYSMPGPHHLELVQGPANTFYDPSWTVESRHIGVWVDDLPQEVERLLRADWTIVAANAAPKDGYGIICYLRPPVSGLILELVSMNLKPAIDEWMAAPDRD
jgi:Glyoxalase/Bleomycin resistance protein/Dioxygenase superfamily